MLLNQEAQKNFKILKQTLKKIFKNSINLQIKTVVTETFLIILLLVPIKHVIGAIVWLVSHQIDSGTSTSQGVGAEDSAIPRPGYEH